MSLKLPDIARLRLCSHQLCESNLKTARDMVSWFGAVQGQEYALTKWGLGLRLPHLADIDIEKELAEGSILRTHLLRPTWHFVSSDDIYWLLRLTAPRVNVANTYMYRKLGLDNIVFRKCNRTLTRLLEGGKQLIRSEINNEFRKNKIEATGHRLSYIMMRGELDGIICSGPRQGNQFTYALLEERVKVASKLNNDEALAELTTRYFNSRGPATIKDFSTWSGLTLSDCKKGLEETNSSFIKEIINNEEYYLSENSVLNKNSPRDICLLPIYDEFIMGYKDRSAILDYRNNLKSIPVLRFDCMVLFDGQIIGTWKRTIAKKIINIEFDFLEKLNKTQEHGVNVMIKRFEKFTGMAVNHVKF